MVRFFITLSYDGTRYHGWQIQPNGDSVQQRLQEALSTILRQPIEVVGAGRTDAGVHARMMVAHFDTEARFEAEEGMTFGLGVTVTSYSSFLNDDTQYVIHDNCGRESAVMLIRNDAPKEQSEEMISYGVNNYDYFLLAYTVTDGVRISSDP